MARRRRRRKKSRNLDSPFVERNLTDFEVGLTDMPYPTESDLLLAGRRFRRIVRDDRRPDVDEYVPGDYVRDLIRELGEIDDSLAVLDDSWSYLRRDSRMDWQVQMLIFAMTTWIYEGGQRTVWVDDVKELPLLVGLESPFLSEQPERVRKANHTRMWEMVDGARLPFMFAATCHPSLLNYDFEMCPMNAYATETLMIPCTHDDIVSDAWAWVSAGFLLEPDSMCPTDVSFLSEAGARFAETKESDFDGGRTPVWIEAGIYGSDMWDAGPTLLMYALAIAAGHGQYNARPVAKVDTRSARDRTRLPKRGDIVVFQKISRPTEMRAGLRSDSPGDGPKKREHDVRGHWRVLGRGTDNERRVWVRSHRRGDPKIGRVVGRIHTTLDGPSVVPATKAAGEDE